MPVLYDEKDIFGGVLVLEGLEKAMAPHSRTLEGLVGLQRTVQLQLLQHYWSVPII